MLTWVGPTTYNEGCRTFKGSVGDNHFNGWRIQGITLEMAAPEDWKYPELTPGDRPEITSNGFMAPEAYNYYKYFLSEIELPDSTQLRFNFGQVTDRPIPFRPIPPKWVVDSCSVGLFTFVDNVVAVEILWGNVAPLEEALRPATWTCTQHQALANCTIESIEDRWVRYRCEGPDGSSYYDVRKEHEVCLSEACALNDPIPRAAMIS